MNWLPFADAVITMSCWSVVDIFSTSFFILSYWFLYSFIKDHDLPLWQKIATACTLLPTLVVTALSININTFYAPSPMPLDNTLNANYLSLLELAYILLVVTFTIVEYVKERDSGNKKKIFLVGAGVFVFLFIFFFAYVIVNFILTMGLFDLAKTPGFVYNISLYALLGMPILLGFLGYLIAKYQAFDVKLIKSIVYMITLMVILFIGLFLV